MYKPEMKHVTCTSDEYKAFKSHPASTLYFLYDTQQIFKGEQEFCPPDGTGDKLPAVTAEDDGKILGVVDGAWNKTDAPSGGNDFVVTYTMYQGRYTADKTYSEIKAAASSGAKITGIIIIGNNKVFCDVIISADVCYFSWFGIYGVGESTIDYYTIYHSNEDIHYSSIMIPCS